jgi:hypothetical protein
MKLKAKQNNNKVQTVTVCRVHASNLRPINKPVKYPKLKGQTQHDSAEIDDKERLDITYSKTGTGFDCLWVKLKDPQNIKKLPKSKNTKGDDDSKLQTMRILLSPEYDQFVIILTKNGKEKRLDISCEEFFNQIYKQLK